MHDEIIDVVKRLHERKLEGPILTFLRKQHSRSVMSGSFVFCDSRNYREILCWLRYEISRGLKQRKDKLSWKQKRRKLSSLWRSEGS